jgi:hypothetical protein
MACHEIAALRLSLMRVLGIDDEAERQHELAELDGAADAPGPLRSLVEARDFSSLARAYESSLSELAQKVSKSGDDDPKLPYLRSLMILTKKVELELASHRQTLERFYRDLEETHDYVHEIYPAKAQ